MTLPTPSDYQEALQLPDLAFADPRLVRGTVAATTLGLPQAITGAFAVVFRVETDAGPKAVRAFLSADPGRAARYRALRAALEAANLPYFVGFEWQSKGLRVGPAAYPILVMDWAEGVPLDRYADTHRDDALRLHALAQAWATMLEALAEAAIAHGDLQHGNVLVREEDGTPRLTLVDYDAMHVPALRGQPAPEVGHRNYQHPDRTEADAGPHADRFPGLVVATALAALAEDPGRWGRYATGENLLFQADDFYAPDASPLFAELRAASDDHVRTLAEALRAACYLEHAAVPSLADVQAGAVPDARARSRPIRAEQTRRTRPRSRFEQVFLPLAFGALLVAVGAFWVPYLLVAAVTLAAVLLGAAARRWRRRPEVRRRHRLDREAAVLDRWIADLDDEARALRARLRSAVGDRADRAEDRLAELQEQALGRHLRRHFVGELDRLDGVGHRAVVRLKAAGIRDAAMATPEAVGALRRVSDPTKVRIAQWRRALERRYADAVPAALPPSEAHRLRRRLERERAQAEGEIRRAEAKAAAQRAERAAVAERLASVPPLAFGRYLAFLLRLRRLA